MPEVVTGQIGDVGASGGSQGAVFFDREISPLQQMNLNNEVLTAGAEQKRQDTEAHLKNIKDIAAAYNPDYTGTRPFDNDYLRGLGQDVQDNMTTMLKYADNPRSQAFQDASDKLRESQNTLESQIAKSKGANQQGIDLSTALVHDKGESLKVKDGLNALATATKTPLNQLGADAYSQGLVPKDKNLQSITVNELAKMQLKPEDMPDEKTGQMYTVKNVGGKDVMQQNTETVSLNRAANLLHGFNENDDWVEAANTDWKKIQGTPAEDYYKQKADEFQAQGLPITNAMDAFKLQTIYNQNQKGTKINSLGENIYSKEALSEKKANEAVRGLYLSAVKFFAGDPQFLKPDYYNSNRQPVGADGKPVIPADGKLLEHKIFVTGVIGLEGRQLGTFLANEEQTTGTGTDAVTKTVQKHPPNLIEKTWRNPDGTISVVTTKSLQKYKEGSLPSPEAVYKTPYSLLTALINGAPAEGKDAEKTDKLLGQLNKVEAEYRNKYGSNWEAQAGLTAEQITERDKIMNTKWQPNIINQTTGASGTQPINENAADPLGVLNK